MIYYYYNIPIISPQYNYTTSIEEEVINSEHSSERVQKLAEAINHLTKGQKQVLFLRFNEEKTYEPEFD